MDATLRTIEDFVRRTSPGADENGRPIASMAVDKVFDSIAMVDFLAFLEHSFGIRISDADVLPQNFRDFASVARLVDSKRATA